MRLIDVDALKEDYCMADNCKDCKTNVRDCEYDHVYTKMDFCGWLDDAPTVDAVPVVRGYWIDCAVKYHDPDYDLWECSECGEKSCCRENYCCNCGADMRERREQE